MCIISGIYDYGHRTWPTWPTTAPVPPPIPPASATPFPTPEQWEAFKRLIEVAKEFDRIANQPDCEDPEKGKWMEQVERRLADLEAERRAT